MTAIEVLSPGNKIGRESRLAYVRKRTAYLESGVSLVEIDLAREGDHIAAIPLSLIPKQYLGEYLACVQRATQPSQIELYPMPLRQPLPNISIPLRRTDKDVLLQIQVLIDQCYQDGRYWRTDYSLALRPVCRNSTQAGPKRCSRIFLADNSETTSWNASTLPNLKVRVAGVGGRLPNGTHFRNKFYKRQFWHDICATREQSIRSLPLCQVSNRVC